jgi:hypothetical protein
MLLSYHGRDYLFTPACQFLLIYRQSVSVCVTSQSSSRFLVQLATGLVPDQLVCRIHWRRDRHGAGDRRRGLLLAIGTKSSYGSVASNETTVISRRINSLLLCQRNIIIMSEEVSSLAL